MWDAPRPWQTKHAPADAAGSTDASTLEKKGHSSTTAATGNNNQDDIASRPRPRSTSLGTTLSFRAKEGDAAWTEHLLHEGEYA